MWRQASFGKRSSRRKVSAGRFASAQTARRWPPGGTVEFSCGIWRSCLARPILLANRNEMGAEAAQPRNNFRNGAFDVILERFARGCRSPPCRPTGIKPAAHYIRPQTARVALARMPVHVDFSKTEQAFSLSCAFLLPCSTSTFLFCSPVLPSLVQVSSCSLFKQNGTVCAHRRFGSLSSTTATRKRCSELNKSSSNTFFV